MPSPLTAPPLADALLADALLAWADDGWRELPWRRTRDPWAVLVSELMLQQTQVARVIPKWQVFVARWPTPSACAGSPVAEVVRAWAGLGYNRRALNLHRCAVVVVQQHGGAIPEDLAALLALPGVGPYTRAAVLAFAYGRDVGVIDTNARRVLARAAAGRPLAAGEAQELADRLVPRGRAWAWNQVVLDLGAQVCTTRAPRCGTCPVSHVCAWTEGDDPAAPPARQSAFEGSDRQGRGRLLDALRDGPVPADEIARRCGWPGDPARAERMAAALIADGFARWTGTALTLS